MQPIAIYVLRDPRTNKVRYVGKSVDPQKRFQTHLACQWNYHCARWIRGLKSQGLCPILEVADWVDSLEWVFYEREFIRIFRLYGAELTNIHEGGQGMPVGAKFSDATKRKMSLVRLGNQNCVGYKHSMEAREHMSASRLGNKRRLGKTHSIETRAKIKASQLKYHGTRNYSSTVRSN